MIDDDSECCGPDGKPFSAHKNSVDRVWAMREIGRLRAERDAAIAERDEARTYAMKRSDRAHEIELELHAKWDAARALSDKLAEALRGVLDAETSWEIAEKDESARAALAEYDAAPCETGESTAT